MNVGVSDTQPKSNLSVPAALGVASIVAMVGLCVSLHVKGYSIRWGRLEQYFDEHIYFLTAALIALTANVVATSSVISRVIGMNQQGSRLQTLVGKKKARKAQQPHLFKRILVSAALAGVTYFVIRQFLTVKSLATFPMLLPYKWKDLLSMALCVNFAGSSFVLSYLVSGFSIFSRFGSLSLFHGRALSPMPQMKNAIVLGSVGEEELDDEGKQIK